MECHVILAVFSIGTCPKFHRKQQRFEVKLLYTLDTKGLAALTRPSCQQLSMPLVLPLCLQTVHCMLAVAGMPDSCLHSPNHMDPASAAGMPPFASKSILKQRWRLVAALATPRRARSLANHLFFDSSSSCSLCSGPANTDMTSLTMSRC
jgi:hypothetical protein